jgi:hypothetical protein
MTYAVTYDACKEHAVNIHEFKAKIEEMILKGATEVTMSDNSAALVFIVKSKGHSQLANDIKSYAIRENEPTNEDDYEDTHVCGTAKVPPGD